MIFGKKDYSFNCFPNRRRARKILMPNGAIFRVTPPTIERRTVDTFSWHLPFSNNIDLVKKREYQTLPKKEEELFYPRQSYVSYFDLFFM